MNPILDTYKYFVQGLVKQMGATKILEIGLGSHATTAEAILKILPKEGKYFAIDVSPNEIALEILKKFSAAKYEIRKIDSQKWEAYEHINDCDMVLIDGHHGESMVYNDAQLCIRRNVLHQDGIFIFHDSRIPTVRLGLQLTSNNLPVEIFYLPMINIAIGKIKY